MELRYAIRMLKGTPAIDRKMVQELRQDLGHYSAQVGLLVSAGRRARRRARRGPGQRRAGDAVVRGRARREVPRGQGRRHRHPGGAVRGRRALLRGGAARRRGGPEAPRGAPAREAGRAEEGEEPSRGAGRREARERRGPARGARAAASRARSGEEAAASRGAVERRQAQAEEPRRAEARRAAAPPPRRRLRGGARRTRRTTRRARTRIWRPRAPSWPGRRRGGCPGAEGAAAGERKRRRRRRRGRRGRGGRGPRARRGLRVRPGRSRRGRRRRGRARRGGRVRGRWRSAAASRCGQRGPRARGRGVAWLASRRERRRRGSRRRGAQRPPARVRASPCPTGRRRVERLPGSARRRSRLRHAAEWEHRVSVGPMKPGPAPHRLRPAARRLPLARSRATRWRRSRSRGRDGQRQRPARAGPPDQVRDLLRQRAGATASASSCWRARTGASARAAWRAHAGAALHPRGAEGRRRAHLRRGGRHPDAGALRRASRPSATRWWAWARSRVEGGDARGAAQAAARGALEARCARWPSRPRFSWRRWSAPTTRRSCRTLQASDPRVREFALRTLAERRHPAAAPLLIEQLKDERRGHGAAGHRRAGGDDARAARCPRSSTWPGAGGGLPAGDRLRPRGDWRRRGGGLPLHGGAGPRPAGHPGRGAAGAGHAVRITQARLTGGARHGPRGSLT